MSSDESEIWPRARLEAYWSATEASERRRTLEREGTNIADSIDARWQRLAPAARALLRSMLLSRTSTLIATHKDDLLEGIVASGLLRKPFGVDTLLLHSHDTTYDFPPAVWKTLRERRADFIADSADDAVSNEAMNQFKRRYRFVERK